MECVSDYSGERFDIFVWYKKEACMLGVRTSTSKVPGQEIVGDGNSSF